MCFDERICEEASLDDIDEKRVRRFLKDSRKQRGLKISEDASIEDAFLKLKLLKNGKPTNAALLLFSKEPIFLQSEVKCIRFKSDKTVKPYADFQTLEGTVIDLVDNAVDFVLRNIRKTIWLVPGKIQREERYEYPEEAIRESIVNAIVHRDYSFPSKVQVRIFDYIKEKEKITNKEYRMINNVSHTLATHELKDLVEKEILMIKGKGRATQYLLKS